MLISPPGSNSESATIEVGASLAIQLTIDLLLASEPESTVVKLVSWAVWEDSPGAAIALQQQHKENLFD